MSGEMSTVDDLMEQALRLSAQARAEMAERLLLSLTDGSEVADDEWIAAWRPELERRIEAYQTGETSAIDWRESVDRVRQALRERRS